MEYLPLNLPNKDHLTIRLSESAEKILEAIVMIANKSNSPIITISSVPGAIRDSYVYSVRSTDNQHNDEISLIYGLPKEELILFKFVLPLGNNGLHVTALAFERVKYQKARGTRKFLMRTTPIQLLIALAVTILSILLALFGALLSILTNLQQLTNQ